MAKWNRTRLEREIATLNGPPASEKLRAMMRGLSYSGALGKKAYDAFHRSSQEHGVYNLGGGTQYTLSLLECIDELESITGLRSEVTYEDWRPSDQKVYITDVEPTCLQLKWAPTTSPRVGLNLTHDWVKENLDIF